MVEYMKNKGIMKAWHGVLYAVTLLYGRIEEKGTLISIYERISMEWLSHPCEECLFENMKGRGKGVNN